MHVRQAIREAVIQQLTGLQTTGANVFGSRVYPIDAKSLPAIVVYTKRESAGPETISPPRTYVRELEVVAEIYVKAVSGYENLLDTISGEIEHAIYAGGDFNGLIKDIYITQTDVNYQDGADQPLASAELEFNVVYTTLEGSVLVNGE